MASGFPSVRRFNATMRDTFRRTPRELRGARAGRTARRAAADALTLRVPFRAPFDWDAMLEYVAGRAIPGVECVERGVWRRAIVHGGSTGLLEVTRSAREPALELRVASREPRDLIGLVARVSRVFDVAADAAGIARHLRRDALLKRAVSPTRGVRVPGAWDPFELAVRAILGQQVSVKGATTIAGRVARTFGAPYEGPAADGVAHHFPTPAALADAPLERAGLTRARAATVRALAAAVGKGTVDFAKLGGLDEAVATLTALPGIGPWTAHYVAMRALGEPDALPAADLGLRRVLGTAGRLASPAEVEARAESWRPWRSYAVLALWRYEGTRTE